MAKLSRRASASQSAKPTRKRGRPPGEPRTTLARWLQDRGLRSTDLAARLSAVAAKLGIRPELVPQPKTLLDAVNGRVKPGLPVVLLVQRVTRGAVGLEHWVRDLFD